MQIFYPGGDAGQPPFSMKFTMCRVHAGPLEAGEGFPAPVLSTAVDFSALRGFCRLFPPSSATAVAWVTIRASDVVTRLARPKERLRWNARTDRRDYPGSTPFACRGPPDRMVAEGGWPVPDDPDTDTGPATEICPVRRFMSSSISARPGDLPADTIWPDLDKGRLYGTNVPTGQLASSVKDLSR